MSTNARAVLVFAAIVGGALALLVLGPTAPDVGQYDAAAVSALASGIANEDRASGAPQQQVVNGWVARDLALVQIDQNNDLLEQQAKTNQLLFVSLVVATIAFAWSVRAHGPAPATPEPARSGRPSQGGATATNQGRKPAPPAPPAPGATQGSPPPPPAPPGESTTA